MPSRAPVYDVIDNGNLKTRWGWNRHWRAEELPRSRPQPCEKETSYLTDPPMVPNSYGLYQFSRNNALQCIAKPVKVLRSMKTSKCSHLCPLQFTPISISQAKLWEDPAKLLCQLLDHTSQHPFWEQSSSNFYAHSHNLRFAPHEHWWQGFRLVCGLIWKWGSCWGKWCSCVKASHYGWLQI